MKKNLTLKLMQQKFKLETYDGSKIKVIGYFLAKVTVFGKSKVLKLYIGILMGQSTIHY